MANYIFINDEIIWNNIKIKFKALHRDNKEKKIILLRIFN